MKNAWLKPYKQHVIVGLIMLAWAGLALWNELLKRVLAEMPAGMNVATGLDLMYQAEPVWMNFMAGFGVLLTFVSLFYAPYYICRLVWVTRTGRGGPQLAFWLAAALWVVWLGMAGFFFFAVGYAIVTLLMALVFGTKDLWRVPAAA